ncbi:hypothetical protein Patl1_35954 [Pistacia atlantica]|nr:hypothetical protein Patl1_35954 [Pistacia atlantica]
MSSDFIAVKFTSKNYSDWEFQFRLFVMGKELWGHIDGSNKAPTDVSKLAHWQTKDARVPEDSLSVVQEIHAQSKQDQFLMKLQPEFEATRSNLMNRNPVPSLDICFGELLREEQRLTTQATYQHDKMISNAMAYAAQGKGKG